MAAMADARPPPPRWRARRFAADPFATPSWATTVTTTQHWLDPAKPGAAGHAPAKIYCVNWSAGRTMASSVAWLQRNMLRVKVDGRPPGRSKANGMKNAFGLSPNYEDISWNGLNSPGPIPVRHPGIDKAAWVACRAGVARRNCSPNWLPQPANRRTCPPPRRAAGQRLAA